ncbi:ISNCY family transposase [Acinetobacter terrestris]|uniref:ISNCY family transposase n=1 Tax=Acinetobacter terrestris TaxID=2529843 RepID=UPI00103B7B12|nr:ISNCY family transposase [Acinetobacter terrestris]TCB48323.1 ISNCY family transposase [Acinetobacter terrestris]
MLITMSDKEIQRLAVLQDVRDHRITQVRAAEILNLSTRQITRLLQKLNQDGVSGLAHASRGQPGYHRHDDLLKSQCLSIISEHLLGFGPTLAHEKLTTVHGFDISVETLRCWMIAANLWIPRSKRLKRPYQPRYNRDCFGELIQIDGSYHDWFEGRAAKCCLLVYIDDATGKLLHLRFCEAETTFDYMLSTRAYIEQYGKPLAFYSDKHSVFRVNQKSSQDSKITQFGRILNELNIDIIFANSPQAKGRVERANRTLQDRLIKEMRLEGIGSIAEANAWLPCFIEQFNQKFAKCARNPKNLHRPLTESDLELDDIFTWQEPRKVTKNLTLTYDKCIYLLEPTELNQKLVGQYISFLEYPDGTVAIMHEGRKINYSIFNKLAGLQQNKIVENKRLGSVLAHIQQQHEELEKQNKRNRSQKMPSRRAQKTAIQQRNLNPVLDFEMSI